MLKRSLLNLQECSTSKIIIFIYTIPKSNQYKMIKIEKPGRSKADLLKSLDKLKSDFSSEISQYGLNVNQIKDGYNLQASKKIMMIKVSVDMSIKAEDGRYILSYETNNVPQSKIDEVVDKAKEVLAKY
jgi:hypothetical protein